MALTVRTLTVATTVDDVEARFLGGMPALKEAHPAVVQIGPLVRLPAPLPGLQCGTWSAQRGAYAVELVPHPDIKLVSGRHRKSAGLIHRSVRLRDEPRPEVKTQEAPPLTTLQHSADLHRAVIRLPLSNAPFAVGGDDVQARALRVALWLCLRQRIPVTDLSAEHLRRLPPDRFQVDATAIAWEVGYRMGACLGGIGNSGQYPRVAIMKEVARELAQKGLTTLFGEYRWPSEQAAGRMRLHRD